MPEGQVVKPILTIKIDGSPVAQTFMDALDEVVVNSDLHLPSMFSIRVIDDKLAFVTSATLALGKAVEISMSALKQNTETGDAGTLFKGEITALEPEYGDDGRARMTIRGYDKMHRLHRGKKTRTFLQTKDSDVVSTIAGEIGLSADAEATTITYDYLLQNNQTNMEFLQERARRLGYWVYVANDKLCFKKAATPESGTAVPLEWNNDLYSFRPSLSGVQQANLVRVLGWDSKAKTLLSGEYTPAKPTNQAGVTDAGGAASQTAFSGASNAVVVNEPLVSANEATALAEGLGARLTRDFLWAEGECLGNPLVKAGAIVDITLKIGTTADTKFGGKYLVTSATHIYNGNDYRTQFNITGQDPNTLSRLLGADTAPEARVPGVVSAVVTNLNDPDKLGRVKVKFPWMDKNNGAEIESWWVRLAAPMAGAQRGWLTIPEVDDEVLVAFDQGNPDFPYIVGGLWNNTDKPPAGTEVAVKDGKVIKRIFKTRVGHIVTFDDTSDKPFISIVDKTGKNQIMIDSSTNTITVNADKDMVFEAKGDISLKANNINLTSQANTTIKATQNVNAEATQNVTIKGTVNVNVEATAALALKGLTAKLEGSTTVEVKGSAMGTFDGGGMSTIKGGLVKIN